MKQQFNFLSIFISWLFLSIFSVNTVSAWNLFGGNSHNGRDLHKDTEAIRDSANEFAEMVTNAIQEQIMHFSKNMKTAKDRTSPFLNEAYLRSNIFLTDFNVDVREDEYFLYLDVPGVRKGDIRIHTDEFSIQVEAKHECPKKHSMMPWVEDEKTCVERNYESTAHFPRDADLSKLQIILQDNVIKARVPRKRQHLQPRTLQDRWEDLTAGAAEMLHNVADKISSGADKVSEKMEHGERAVTRSGERLAHHVHDETKEKLDL